METDGLWLKLIFYRPVIRYTTGQIGFFRMLNGMFWRFFILAILCAIAFGIVANDEGVFKQDGNRPDPAIADAARHKAEADAYKRHQLQEN